MNYTHQSDDVPRGDLRHGSRTSWPAARRSTASAPPRSRWAQPSNKNNVGLGDLPLHLPGRPRHGPALLRVQDPRTDERRRSGRTAQILLPPTFTWGNRVANAPPNLSYPAWLNLNRTHDFSLSLTKVWGRHTLEDRLLQPPQPQGAEPRHRRPELRRARRDELRQQHQQPDRLAVRLRQRGARASSTRTPQMSRFMEGSFVYNNREAYIQDNWKVNSKLTLDYGMRFVHQQPQYDALRPGLELPARDMGSVAGAACCTSPAAPTASIPARAPTARRWTRGPTSSWGRSRRCRIGQLVPNTGNLTNGIFLAGQGIVEDGLQVADARAGAAVRVRLRRQRQSAVHLPRRDRPLLRPPGRQLDLRPGRQSAERVDRHDQLRAAAEPDVEHLGPAGADGLRVRRRSCRRRCSGAPACRWRCRGRRRSTCRTSVSTATTWDRPSTSTRSTWARPTCRRTRTRR